MKTDRIAITSTELLLDTIDLMTRLPDTNSREAFALVLAGEPRCSNCGTVHALKKVGLQIGIAMHNLALLVEYRRKDIAWIYGSDIHTSEIYVLTAAALFGLFPAPVQDA